MDSRPLPFPSTRTRTPAIPEIIAMKPAIDYLYSLGSEAMLVHERALMDVAIRGLRDIGGFRHWGPDSNASSGIPPSRMSGSMRLVGAAIGSAGIAVRVGHHCALPLQRRFGLRDLVARRSMPTTRSKKCTRCWKFCNNSTSSRRSGCSLRLDLIASKHHEFISNDATIRRR